ncbi:SETMAR [Cordylochernes scorpioides]|uniref:SETMAR n=1 Tax=Cordylochernes scorpioides TaxID=51811 RepID=A0ABY6LM57_9ARAC|nr:SETMAR [Cordylochernes scorpioides]
MVISDPKSAHLREVLLFAFNWKKCATEAHRMLEEVHGDHALSKSQCYRWFKKFQSGDFELDNEPRRKPHQKCEDAELQALLDDDSTQTQEKLAKQLQVSQEIDPLQQSYAPKVVGPLGQFPKRKPRPNRLGKKAMLCVWWDQTGVVYFKLLKPGETVNTSRYEQQMHSLREALNEKRPELREKHNKLILLHDNAPAHNATVVKNTIKDLGWELLPHPLYSPDLAPSDYHLFTSLGHALKSQEFSNSDILRKWLVDWFDSKGIEIFRQGIRKLPERTPKMCKKITDLIKENPRTTLLELEKDTGISKTTIGRIVTKDLKLKKTPAKFIPRFLTNEQKLCRLATCENMLEMTRTDPEWKDKVITGEKTWVYGYDPETKRQSAEWRGQSEPRPKKSRILKSRNKVLLVAFLDNKGIVHHEYLPAGQTVIKEMYLDILRHLREAIREKMPEKWPNGDWILHYNNARPHTAHLVTSFFWLKTGQKSYLNHPIPQISHQMTFPVPQT